MHTNHSPDLSYVLEPVDSPSSRKWQSDCHRVGGCRASLPPSEHLHPQHSRPDSALQYICQIHGEAKVTPSALQTYASKNKCKYTLQKDLKGAPHTCNGSHKQKNILIIK